MRRIAQPGMNLAMMVTLLAPLEPFPGLTSGFGEYREGGRFHAGLDYSTGGHTGAVVRAVADGWVERVRTSGVGYGRSLYLRLADGRTAVYGHLDRFAPALEAYVAARQDSSGNYEQDLWPRAGALRFRAGETIAWSGQTGAGPPHLHFELRRGDLNLHPMKQGIAIADRTPPSIAAVTCTPAEPGARVGERFDSWRGEFQGTKALSGPTVRGPFFLGLDTWDQIGSRSNHLATYRLRVELDGRPAYEAVLDSVSWDDMAIADRVFELATTRAGMSDRRSLQSIPGDRSGVVRRGSPRWELAPGPHVLRFLAEDEAGNRTTRTLEIRAIGARDPRSAIAPAPGASAMVASGDATSPRLVPRGRGAIVVAGRDAGRPPFARWPELTIVDSLVAANGGSWAVTTAHAPGAGPGASGLFVAGGGAGTLTLAPGIRLSWSAEAFYEPVALVVAAEPAVADPVLPAALPTMLRLESADLALARPVRLSWQPAELAGRAVPRVGLFRRSGPSWSFLAGRDSSGAWSASTRRLGTFALLADTTAPHIVPPREYVARVGSIAPALSFGLTDRGAGLVAAEQRMLVDGRRVPAEYDPDADRLTWRPRAPLAAGAHQVVVEAVDALGNRASVRLPVEVR